MSTEGGFDPNGEARAAQWDADRKVADTPLPHADLRHYENDEQRQQDLAAAEKSNIARAAGELGMTTAEWHTLRGKLGRSPGPGDV